MLQFVNRILYYTNLQTIFFLQALGAAFSQCLLFNRYHHISQKKPIVLCQSLNWREHCKIMDVILVPKMMMMMIIRFSNTSIIQMSILDGPTSENVVSTKKRKRKITSQAYNQFVWCENCEKSVNKPKPKKRGSRGKRFNLIVLYIRRVNSMLYCKLNSNETTSVALFGVREIIWLP